MQERKNRFIIFDDLELKSDIVSNDDADSGQTSNMQNNDTNSNDFINVAQSSVEQTSVSYPTMNQAQSEQPNNIDIFAAVNQVPSQQSQQDDNSSVVSDSNLVQNVQSNNRDIFTAVNQVPNQRTALNNPDVVQIQNQNNDVSDTIPEDITVIKQDNEGRILFDEPQEQTEKIIESKIHDIHTMEQKPLPVEDSIYIDQMQSVVEEEANSELKVPNESLENSSLIEEKEEKLNDLEEIVEDRKEAFQNNRNLQDMINKILKIDTLTPVQVHVSSAADKELEDKRKQEELARKIETERVDNFRKEIYEVIKEDDTPIVFKSDLLDKVRKNSEEVGTFSILARYGEDYCAKNFVTNPSIGRDEEIKQLILTLLTPEKSAILIGKPGIGKTSIVEGLAFRIQRGLVPEALKNFSIVNIKTPSLIGSMPNGETRLQTLVDELKQLDHVILFIDEIHMLIGATNDSAMDFANMFKEGLGRGQIKVIGATTTEEYERYILRDKAFVRRFQSIEVLEPSREHTIKILMGTLPKIEKETCAKMKYTTFIKSEIMAFIVDITSEFKRVYGIGSRYPDICLTLVKEAFSQCIFDNRDQVTIFDVRDAIANSKNIYPDVIRKELPKFDEKFKKIIDEENAEDASIDRL